MLHTSTQIPRCRRTTRICLAAFTTATMFLPSVEYARGATETWQKTAPGTYSWNSNGAGNWSPDTAFPNSTADVANLNTLNISGAETINLNTAITLNGLNLGDTTTTFFAYTLAPNTGSLIFDGTNPFLNFQGGANVISAPVTLNSTATTFTGLSGSLNMSGDVAYNNAAAGTLTLAGATGTISNSITQSGAGALSLVNYGTWTLSIGNTFAGTIALNGGTLTAGSATAIGSTPTISFNGGVLALGALNYNITSTSMVAGGITGSGTVTNSANYTVRASDFSVNLAGNVAVNKSSDGTLGFSGTNSFTGATTATGGILYLDYTSNNTSKLADAASLTLGGGASVVLT